MAVPEKSDEDHIVLYSEQMVCNEKGFNVHALVERKRGGQESQFAISLRTRC